MSSSPTSMAGISDSVNQVLGDGVRQPFMPLPAILLTPELQSRSGLSAIALTSAIIRRLPEAGIETGPNPDGSENMICQFVRIIAEEVVKEIKDNARVTSVITPGSVTTLGTGGNAGGPVTVLSSNTLTSSTLGLIE